MIFKNISSKKILFFILLLNMVVLVGYVFLFNKIEDKNEEMHVIGGDLRIKKSKEFEAKFVSDNLQETLVEREKINSYFVQEGKSGVAKFVEELESISDTASVLLKVSSIILKKQDQKKEASEKFVEDMQLSLVVEGSWNEITHFLNLLSLASYNLSLDKVHFEKTNIENTRIWEGLINITVSKISD